MLVYGLLTKDYKNRYYAKQKLNHLDAFDVSLFGLDFSYKNFILFFIILIGISIYLFLYVKDDIIKEKASNFIEFKKNNSENNIEKAHPVFHTSVDKEPLIFARLFAFFIDIFISISLISFIWGILYLPVWKGYLDNKSFLGMMAFTNPMVLIFRIIYFASFESSKWLGTQVKC